MMKEDMSLAKLTSFITDKYGSFIVIDENTKLEEDLRITGDEAWEFLIEYGELFNVDVSALTFSDYFEAEGLDFITPILVKLKLKEKKVKKTLIIEDLIKGIEFGRLDEDVLEK